MKWAIVIGVDDYGHEAMNLRGAVADAVRFTRWALKAEGGHVPESNIRLLLGRRPDDPEREKLLTFETTKNTFLDLASDKIPAPTKDNIVTAINDVVIAAAGGAERLFFYFAGHGITARVANRDEGALVLPGFDDLHTDHSLALRSLTEHLETTPFADQFFLIDACRNVPWQNREFEIGRWPIPRKREPGQSPVQQFILHATSPGLTAAEVGWPGEEMGAFTQVLLSGLDGDGRAKAWSWERNCYEVRWEGLATYVNDVMTERKHPTKPEPGAPAAGWPIQIPQDAGSRGVEGRDRDALLVSFGRGRRFPPVKLTLTIEADPAVDETEVSVLDAIGAPVVSAHKAPGRSVTFSLPPKTYAAQVVAPDERIGRVAVPINLYEELTQTISLQHADGNATEPMSVNEAAAAGEALPGTIVISSPDPLSTGEIRDEAGQVVAVTAGNEESEQNPGFYSVRHVGPESAGAEHFVVLRAGNREPVELSAPPPTDRVVGLVRALGGSVAAEHVVPVSGAEPVSWPQPSTLVLAGLGAALHRKGGLGRLGLKLPRELLDGKAAGVALYVVAADQTDLLEGLHTRIWAVGDDVPEASTPKLTEHGVAGHITVVDATPHWVSFERAGTAPTVTALPVLPGRLATVVVQVESDRLHSYQVHPVAAAGSSSSPDRLRRLETLERLLLSGRLDGAPRLARELASPDVVGDDPFAGCLAGYVLLRLGLHTELGPLASRIIDVAPGLSDGYILRGEFEAAGKRRDAAAQAFMNAVNAGIPAFGEGLTRLVEGLRMAAFTHPRGALVRHIFQRHARGSMWAEFKPSRGLQTGDLVITGADVGFAG